MLIDPDSVDFCKLGAMMSEELTENGRINEHGHEELATELPPTPDMNSPRPSVTTPPHGAMEYFDHKGGGSETGSEGGSSPHTQDNVSHHSPSYVTVSPSISPDRETPVDPNGAQFGTERDPVIVKPKPLPCKNLASGVLKEDSEEEEEEEEENRALKQGEDLDLKIEVTEREKVGVKSDAYINYKISTASSRRVDRFERAGYVVWRRYRDFEWLREMLEKHHFTLIVPPLPGKQLTRYFDQKSEEFLNGRQKALDKFLKRLAAHPYFSFNKHLKAFLTAEPTEFTASVAETSSSNRLLGSVASSVKMAANSFRLKNPDPEYAKQAKYFEELGEKLNIVERIAIRLHTERDELVSNMEEMSTEFAGWGLNEPHLVTPIRALGTCVENCTSSLVTLNENNAYSMMVSAKEYQLFCASGVSAVRRRDGLQLDQERAGEEREKRKKVHNEAVNARKLQKLPKLADDLQKAGVEAERTLDDLSIANEQLRVDIEKWKDAKDGEIASLMTTFADNHINHHRKCFDEWGEVLALLRGPMVTPALADGSLPTLGAASAPKALPEEALETLHSPDLFT